MLQPWPARRRGLELAAVVAVFLLFGTYSIIRLPAERQIHLRDIVPQAAVSKIQTPLVQPPATPIAEDAAGQSEEKDSHDTPTPIAPTAPTISLDPKTHPILQLVQQAEKDTQVMLARQSTTLDEAVAEYRRRYGIPPPPHFDAWFAFAQARGVVLVDEFDSVHEMLTPFWGMKPSTIRKRAAEALGYLNSLMGVVVRNHEVVLSTGGTQWEREAITEMMGSALEYLPDMDLAFNALDEPRVMLQHGDLARLVEKAKVGSMAAAAGKKQLTNGFTKEVEGLGDGSSIAEVPNSRFVYIGRQSAWAEARMSCPPDSPARALDEDDAEDDTSGYCATDLCFISNTTAFSDVCSAPSLARMYGFFDRPNAFSVSHDLVPIFSPSKLSTFADILFPSPWYWTERVKYNESMDMAWEDKADQLYWRGSTTGGFSRWGGWRRHHRQRFVAGLNDLDGSDASILVKPSSSNDTSSNTPDQDAEWTIQSVPKDSLKHLLNATFSHTGQCDPGDCAAQRHAFPVSGRADQQAAWGHKLLLDLDGNAYSGRFQAFLRSRSLVLKFALFREWSGGWLRAWRDYVPLSLAGDEWFESVRFLGEDEEGRKVAEGLAEGSREWTGRVLRKEDMEVWFFRLLLEYARVIDDNRENIGYM